MKIDLLRLLMVISKYSLRLFIIHVICMNFVSAKTSNSQILDEIKVSLSVDRASLTQVLQEIEKKTDFVFAYTESVQKIQTSFTLAYDQASLRKILEDISVQGRLQFKRINNTISVVHSPKERVKEPSVVTAFTITGKVTDEQDLPLPGVNVILKGTTTGTTTDAEGQYSLSLPDEASNGTLVFSFIGYLNQEIPIAGRTIIDVALSVDVTTLEEVVVVGYGTQKKSHVTGSISKVVNETLDQIPLSTADEALVGQVSGVNIQSTGSDANGSVGSSPTIRIRGTGSITGGSDPLLVIDGVNVDNSFWSSIDMNDVQSIEVLKDAASAAVFGSRGANSVIMITTKQGKSGKTKFSYHGFYGVQDVARNPDYNTSLADGLAAELEANGELSARSSYKQLIGVDTDWQEVIFNGGTTQSHTVSARGGNDKTTFSTAMTYLHDEGGIDHG